MERALKTKLLDSGLFDEPFPCENFCRVWDGPCATTGKTAVWFLEAFSGCTASIEAKRAAMSICRSYDITGLCDPAYIANVIQRELDNGKG